MVRRSFLVRVYKGSNPFIPRNLKIKIMKILIIIIKTLSIIVPVIIAVVFFDVAKRKIIRAIQKRRDPNVTGFTCLLQALADGFKYYFKELKLAVPMLVLVISVLFLVVYNTTNDPYRMEIKILVFIITFILNLAIFNFYKNERRIAFTLFIINCLLIFLYIRVSTNTMFPISLIYYAIIFIGFHIFEETFSKRFYLRTKIILIGYYSNFEFIKIVLWFFLVLLPSLIKEPILMYSVYQPLMAYCYLFEYDFILLFLFLFMLRCLLLILMNKYKIAPNFLKKCLAYFSRRACLHYVGNMFGAALRKGLSGVNPLKVAGTFAMTLGVSYIPSFTDFVIKLDNDGITAANTSEM